jgi:predicted nucleotidyltransferase
MGQALGHTADELGCSERTLRRYIGDGLLHGRRVGYQGFELSAEEVRYLKAHWALLHTLKAALRTERDVRLAVLFGSMAVGDDEPSSDIDLLVAHRRPEQRALAGLQGRLRRVLNEPVHIVSLDQARNSPSLLADILQEGRPLIDRDDLWSALRAQADGFHARAAHEDRATAASALETIAEARARLRCQAAMLGARTWTLACCGPRSMAA